MISKKTRRIFCVLKSDAGTQKNINLCNASRCVYDKILKDRYSSLPSQCSLQISNGEVKRWKSVGSNNDKNQNQPDSIFKNCIFAALLATERTFCSSTIPTRFITKFHSFRESFFIRVAWVEWSNIQFNDNDNDAPYYHYSMKIPLGKCQVGWFFAYRIA